MRYTDVAIVGGGLAGSTAAAMLGRAGVSAVLIDPHPVYPPELRCEKLGGDQLDLLRKTGLAEATLRATTLDGEVWEARFGYVSPASRATSTASCTTRWSTPCARRSRPVWKPSSPRCRRFPTATERQQVMLSNGEEISARLVVLANGLNIGLRHMLGIERQVISSCHSITLGFDVAPVGRAAFDFPALTYWPKRASSRMAYMTLFPIGSTMRVNLMVYRDMTTPGCRSFARRPKPTMRAMMPRLQRMMGDFKVSGPIKIRPADLYINERLFAAGHRAGGRRLLHLLPGRRDRHHQSVHRRRRLCNVYIPRWLATRGDGRAKDRAVLR